MKLYKLTNLNDETRAANNICKWGKGVTHRAVYPDINSYLCTSAWIHAYEGPLTALALDQAGGLYVRNRYTEDEKLIKKTTFHLWLAEGEVGRREGGKVGCVELTTIRRIAIPRIPLVVLQDVLRVISSSPNPSTYWKIAFELTEAILFNKDINLEIRLQNAMKRFKKGEIK